MIVEYVFCIHKFSSALDKISFNPLREHSRLSTLSPFGKKREKILSSTKRQKLTNNDRIHVCKILQVVYFG